MFIIKYLNLPYFLGKFHYSVSDLSIRKQHLLVALAYFEDFIQKCVNYRVVEENELEKVRVQIFNVLCEIKS